MTREQEDCCFGCRHIQVDYIEYLDGYKVHFFDGCKEGLEPVWDDEEQCLKCNARRE